MIAVDWGTSSFRAYLLDGAGNCLQRRESPLGILKVQHSEFAQALDSQINDWISAGEQRVVMSGMIGSRQGWREAPYVRCPGGASELAQGLVDVTLADGTRGWIVAGMITQNASGIHDVMRGEETQLVGAMQALGSGQHTVCLPGTHSKWVKVANGRIESFRTHMTGEVFAVLSEHSILGRTFTDTNAANWQAFERGVIRAKDSGGLLHHLFNVRAEALAGALAASEGRDYLSGVLIGSECVAELAVNNHTKVNLLCAPHMAQRYQHALSQFCVTTNVLDPDAAVAGLYHIARAHFGKDME